MKLKDWVEMRGGARAVAKMLKVNKHTVNCWLRGTSTPKATTMVQIVKLAKGFVTYETIVLESSRTKVK